MREEKGGKGAEIRRKVPVFKTARKEESRQGCQGGGVDQTKLRNEKKEKIDILRNIIVF